jgi:hypothetical protein
MLDSLVRSAIGVIRRKQRFVLIRGYVLGGLPEGALVERPKSLADLLSDYDVQKIRTLTRSFRNDAPAGREMI